MKKLTTSIMALVASFLLAGSAMADNNLKVAVVDLQQIIQKSPQFAQINEQLTKQFKPRQDKLVAAQKNLQSEMDRLNRDNSVMSVTDRNKLQDQIIAERANAQGMALSFQRDLSTAQNQAMQGLMSQVSGVINTVAKKDNYDIVLQRAGVPFVKDNLDITNQVIQTLQKK